MTVRKCSTCKQTKPLDAFSTNPSTPTGISYRCKVCKAKAEQERRKGIPAEDKAEAARALRAGMRKDKCAICRAAIQGHGICDSCADAVETLGGLEGLKQAVRAVKYLTSE
jgi:hypothetical protein